MLKIRTDFKVIIIIILALIGIQAVRALSTRILFEIYAPAMLYANFTLAAIGVLLFLILKPGRLELGLDFRNHNKRSKRIYIIFTAIIFTLITISLMLYSKSLTDIFGTVESAVLFPVFEELLFRGYLWDRLEKHNMKGLQTYVITAVLFGLWHLGYWDVIYYRASRSFADINMAQIMLFKVFTGLGYGIITGFVMYKTKNAYGSILIHSFLNIFGR